MISDLFLNSGLSGVLLYQIYLKTVIDIRMRQDVQGTFGKTQAVPKPPYCSPSGGLFLP